MEAQAVLQVRHSCRNAIPDDKARILQSLAKPSCWAIHVVPGLKFFAYDRIALQGDAVRLLLR